MHGHFDALARFGMDAVAVEKFQFFGERREPGFAQAIVFERDVEFTLRAENFHGQSVEEFVGEDDEGNFGSQCAAHVCVRRQRSGLGRLRAPIAEALGRLCSYVRSAGIKVLAQGFLEFGSQRGRRFLQRVSERREEVVEFLVAPIQHIAGEQSAPGAKFENLDFSGAVECSPYLVKLARQQASEDGMNVARGIEVSRFAELFGVGGIVTMGRIVEADLHVARKRHGAVLPDFLLDLFPDRQLDGQCASSPRFPLRHPSDCAGPRYPAGCG